MLMANFGQASEHSGDRQDQSGDLGRNDRTTRSRVSYFLNRFRDLGYIDYSSAG